MTTLQQQARALGDPSRHEIFRYVMDSPRPVGVAELTEHMGLNHNAVRQHLAKLVDAGLLLVGTLPSKGRGRPRLVYEVAPSVHARWGAQSPYERLSLLLSDMLATGDSAEDVGSRSVVTPAAIDDAGAAPGDDAAPVDPVAELTAEMARQGFEPEVREDGENVEVVLHNCPFASTALADPANVCGLHLGIARGVAATTGGLVVDELVRHDPRQAGCRLLCHRE